MKIGELMDQVMFVCRLSYFLAESAKKGVLEKDWTVFAFV